MFSKITKIIAAFLISFQVMSLTISDGTVTARVSGGDLISDASTDTPGPSSGTLYLAFQDMDDGPDTGLGDGLGDGTIVTIWGVGIGDLSTGIQPSTGKRLVFVDFANVVHYPYVYYSQNATGSLPGGPANLYASHGFSEVAFSIPDSATGLGTIKIIDTDDSESNTLPFLVRTGNIYHVKPTGNDTTGNGGWSTPWLTVDKAENSIAEAGAILYIHNVDSGDSTPVGSVTGIYINTGSNLSGIDNQWAVSAYPNTRPTASGTRGIAGYNVEGMVWSKIDVYSSSHTSVDANGQPSGKQDNTSFGIKGTKNGRAVGNRLTDIPGGCASSSSGGITGNSLYDDFISNFKVFGNEIYEYGCAGSNKLHHTTYFSVRSGAANEQLTPYELGWNYLHDNEVKNGLHSYDQNTDASGNCGGFTAAINVHDNVVINQAGAGISYGMSGCSTWTGDFNIYNNVIKNVALAAAWNGLDVNTSDGPNTSGISVSYSGTNAHIRIYNNIVYDWNADGQTANTRAAIGLNSLNGVGEVIDVNDNIFVTNNDVYFINEFNSDDLSGILTVDNNVYYYTGSSPSLAITPSNDSNAITGNPLVTFTGAIVTIGSGSSAEDQSTTTLPRDIYGIIRAATSNVGAVE